MLSKLDGICAAGESESSAMHRESVSRSVRCVASRAVLLVAAGLAVAACGGAGTSSHQADGPSPAAKPAKPSPAGSAVASPSAATSPNSSLAMPPFGTNTKIEMTSWLPASPSEAKAVINAKDFLLAILYADYTGGRDHRWENYAGSALVRSGMAKTLAAPDISTESFTGTIQIWHMSAVVGLGGKNTVGVTECVNSAGALNTSLRTGKVLPRSQQNSTDENYYSNTDILAQNAAGQWTVTSIPADIYYPQAFECKP
jgi:hypothetical protein